MGGDRLFVWKEGALYEISTLFLSSEKGGSGGRFFGYLPGNGGKKVVG